MDLPWLLVLLLALLLVGVVAAWLWERGRVARGNRGRQRVAAAGEAGAEALVEEAGFTVVERQAWAEWVMEVDGVDCVVGCRADLIVERDGELYVAEVKTGALAPDPCRPATRRQLLEYALAFDVDGLLLIDMVAAQIRSVRLPVGARGPPG